MSRVERFGNVYFGMRGRLRRLLSSLSVCTSREELRVAASLVVKPVVLKGKFIVDVNASLLEEYDCGMLFSTFGTEVLMMK